MTNTQILSTCKKGMQLSVRKNANAEYEIGNYSTNTYIRSHSSLTHGMIERKQTNVHWYRLLESRFAQPRV